MRAFFQKRDERNLGTICSEVFIILGCALVLSQAFPSLLFPKGLGFLSLISLIPVFSVIRNTRFRWTPLYGFIFGAAFYASFNYWLTSFHPLAIYIVLLIKGLECALLFMALKGADSWCKRYSYLVQALIWVAYAYIAQSWFAGYPYGIIAYALWNYLPLIQIASIGGIWPIVFLQVLPQAYLGRMLADGGKFRDHKKALIVLGSVLLVWLVSGSVALAVWSRKPADDTLKVACIQHNADSWKGGYTTYKRNFNNLRKMSLEAEVENPDLVIWSETAFVPSVAWHQNYPTSEDTSALVDEFVEFGKSFSVPLVTGNPEGVWDDRSKPPVAEDGTWNRMDYNTVIMFENGEIQDTYRKQHLVPFTEHFPYEDRFPRFYQILKDHDYHWWLPGDESHVFYTDSGIGFSTPICFEDVFGDLNAAFVRNGADLFMNMTNDNWSKSVPAEMQHAVIAVFRSVENRRTMLRSTNSGISCYITPSGKLMDPMEPFKAYWHIYNVPVFRPGSFTLYTRWGDWFARGSVLFATLALITGAVANIFYRKKENQ